MIDFCQKAIATRDRAQEAAEAMRDAKKNADPDAAAWAAINAATACRSASRAALQAQEQNEADAEDATLFAVESRAVAANVLRQAASVFDSVDITNITKNAKPHETYTHTTDAETAIKESAAQAQEAEQNVHDAKNDAKEAREKKDPVAAARSAIAAVTAYQETRKAIRKGLHGGITYRPLSNIIGIVHVTKSATTDTLRIAADVLDKA